MSLIALIMQTLWRYPGLDGMAMDIYGEGIRIPPIRLVRAGELDPDLMRMILTNVRGQEERRGDFRRKSDH